MTSCWTVRDASRPTRRAVTFAAVPLATLSATGGLARLAVAQNGAPGEAEAGEPFTFETVIRMAEAAAAAKHEPAKLSLSGPFADLGYDAYRAIRFREERRVFAGGPFEIDLLPPGHFYEDRVEIAIVRNGLPVDLAFDPGVFHFHPDYFPFPDGVVPADAPRDLSWSGFRIRARINRPEVMDEVAVFQGATYFRAVARDLGYGLSARGLAVGTASPEGEEFPLFRRFFIHEPEAGANAIRVQALLDSPSLSGAYDVLVTPGAETQMEVTAVLFPRREIREVGIAPLTSMFYFGPGSRARVDDYREAVHDSDGLQMITGAGERLWRPLRNPSTVQVSAFADENPRGFGLSQRSRALTDFEDAEARYERRPSGWVVPQGDWGEGAIVLVELPTGTEFNDNIVCFWRPACSQAPAGPTSVAPLAARRRAARPRARDPRRSDDRGTRPPDLRRRLLVRGNARRGHPARGEREQGRAPQHRHLPDRWRQARAGRH